MNSRKTTKLIISALTFLFLGSIVPTSHGQESLVPTFPSCANPQGTTVASYNSGTHGIAGDSNVNTGTDAVYSLTQNTLVQCFCPDVGTTGVQTNWWEVGEMSFDEIQYYQTLGWIYIPNGAAWGLNEGPYLAFNQDYACKPTGGGGNEDEDDDDDDDDDDKDEDDDEGDVLGTATGIGGQVLGLAATGYNKALIISFATWISSLGILLLIVTGERYGNRNSSN